MEHVKQSVIYSKGKGTHEPTQFLPVLPAQRTKPAWQISQPSFFLSIQNEAADKTEAISDLTPRTPHRRQLPVRLKPIETNQKNDEIEMFKQPKRDREQFRKALVEIIMVERKETQKSILDASETETAVEITRAASPTAAEKDILRYYYYIHHGIDTEHVAPMEDAWLQNVLKLISAKLKEGHQDTIDNLSDEMRDDYLLSVKKAIVDFVLKDPRQMIDDKKEQLPLHREEMAVVPKPWARSYLVSQDYISKHLHNTNPCMMQVLELWYISFGKLRFIDTEEFQLKEESMELSTFQSLCMRHVDAAKDKLMKKWFPEVQTIFYQGNKRKLVPSSQEQEKLDSFFSCAATLMTQNLQTLTLDSIRDYTNLLVQPPTSVRAYEHSGFILRLILDETEIKFEPTFSDYQVVLVNVFDVMIKASRDIPRVETKLYSEWSGNKAKAFLRPIILDEILDFHKTKVHDLIIRESVGPTEHTQVYNKYSALISKQADDDVTKFMEEQHTFDEYAKELLKYHRLVDEITYSSVKILRLGMFEVHCDELIRALTKRADYLKKRLLIKMCEDHQRENKKLVDQYKEISDKALSTPENTEKLMEQMAYINKCQSETIFVLEKLLIKSKDRLTFLSDHANFSPAETRLNSDVFKWNKLMPGVFEENKLLTSMKRTQYEDALKIRRERFVEELESYAKQVDEFQSFGDMAEINRYLKKAQSLDNKLQAAAEKIEAFNNEEEAFGWDTTAYPQRGTVINNLRPYLQLYELTVDFNTKYKAWMDGPMIGVDPDVVDQDVGNFWRSLYKLEKTFDSLPAPKKIASKVKTKVEEFKEHLPLIQTLFNPGLRERHWTQISDIIGYHMFPDDSYCLSRLVDMNLEPFIPKFESISESASKEFSLEKAMRNMKKEWAPIEFVVVPYRETGTSILSSIDDIQQLLDDHIVKTQTMRGSPFIKPFEQEIK
ncbi:hypothetical protein BsWGS_24997 [Bradybaena similaris]